MLRKYQNFQGHHNCYCEIGTKGSDSQSTEDLYMKTILVLFATVFSFSAQALDSFYGDLTYSKGEYHCTYKNDGHAKNFKYVIYTLESRTGGDSMAGFNDQQRIDLIVAPYETITTHSGDSMVSRGQYCRFLAR